jgi:hypothetical protein
MGSSPEPAVPAYRRLRMPRKRPEVLEADRIITKLGCWTLQIGQYEVSLVPERFGGDFYLQLFVDYVRQPKRWVLSSRPLRGKLHRGGFIPWDKSEVWYVIGSNGKRYRHLSIHPEQLRIGTREEFGAWYDCDC